MEPAHPVVMKFGGTSVEDAAALRRLIETVGAESRRRIVVVSALAGVTDALSELADGRRRGSAAGELVHRLLERHIAIIRELVAPPRQRALIERMEHRFEQVVRAVRFGKAGPAERDAILAVGELASSQVVSAVLAAAGFPSSWVDARDVVVTDASHGAARPDRPAIRVAARRYLSPLVQAGRIPVLGGFVGGTPAGVTTTLGRGGSDYTASLVGAALAAAEVQIWTDVDGVFTGDPREVDRPALIPLLSFQEAYELARFGAKVLHWGTLEPASADDIPVRVLNARQRGGAGTAVRARERRAEPAVVGVAHQVGVTLVELRARGVVGSLRFLQAAMGWLEREGQAVTVICLSQTSMVVASSDQALLDRLVAVTEGVATSSLSRDVGLVAAVGAGIVGHAAAWRVVHAARQARQVEAIVAAQSGDALVCVTSRESAARVLAQLHQTFFGGAVSRRSRRGTAAGIDDQSAGSIRAGAAL